MDTNIIRITGFILMLLALNGCSTVPAFPVAQDNPSLQSVHANPSAFENHPVVWGGQILATDVTQTTSTITLLGKPLDSNGEPIATDSSDGRFLARLKGFHDPAIFRQGRTLTVSGIIVGSETRKIGDYNYVYPIVKVQGYQLWPVRKQREDYDGWYDPWWNPWYPWYPWYYYPGYVPYPRKPAPPSK